MAELKVDLVKTWGDKNRGSSHTVAENIFLLWKNVVVYENMYILYSVCGSSRFNEYKFILETITKIVGKLKTEIDGDK